jgi:uncharacterized protein (DUF885 family)
MAWRDCKNYGPAPRKELGEKFDQREFHDAILKNSALPLEILEEQVNKYIRQKNG